MVQGPEQNIKTEADYITAAKALPQDHLGNAFGGGHDFEEYTKAQQTIKQIAENASDMAQLSGSNEGLILTGAATVIKAQQEQGDGKNSKKNKGNDTINLITLLSQLNNRIANLENSIADREQAFEDRYGDAWVEIVAQKILDPDEMPERQDGESIPDWRARVEDAMNKKMIDPDTGEIRDEYINHPDQDVREMAKLAQEKYDLEKLEELKRNLDDPNLSDEEKRELIEEYSQSSTGSRILLERVLTPEQIEEFDQNTDEFDPELQSGGTLDALSMT
ncbi:MAG: hypothetical protein JKY84_02480 [Emcibacteraceae bacterium]|nr:hypothetical protein [Emcibacteraceae bacterium]